MLTLLLMMPYSHQYLEMATYLMTFISLMLLMHSIATLLTVTLIITLTSLYPKLDNSD